MLRDQSFVQSAPLPTKRYILISSLIIGRLVGNSRERRSRLLKTCGDGLSSELPDNKHFLKSSVAINAESGALIFNLIRWLVDVHGPRIIHFPETYTRWSSEWRRRGNKNDKPAFGLSGFLSGWHCKAFCRYAFLICNKYKGMQLVK